MNDIEPTNAAEGAKRNAMIDELRALVGCPDHETNDAIVALIRSGDTTRLAKMEAIIVAHGFNFARFCAKSLQNDTENEQAKACFERTSETFHNLILPACDHDILSLYHLWSEITRQLFREGWSGKDLLGELTEAGEEVALEEVPAAGKA